MKEQSPLAEQSFGMFNIVTHRIVFELCLMKKEEEERRKKKKEDEQNRIFQVWFSRLC